MVQRTLGQVKPYIAEVAGATGMSVTNPRVVQYINAAIEELMATGDYPGIVDRWMFRFNQHTGLVALPYVFDRMMQATTDHCPKTIVSPWFEFVAYGPGIQDDYDARGNRRYCWTDVIYDRGDFPVQRQIPDPFELTGPWVLRVYAAVDEEVDGENPVINFQGLDQDGLIIRSLTDGTAGDWYDGENIEINAGLPYVEGTKQFSKITGVVKPETNGYVKVTAYNGTVEVELSNYAYNETIPSYRHYYIPRLINRLDDDTTERILLARCRKRFVPVNDDNDVLIIGNIQALQEMVIAQWKRVSDRELYILHRDAAIKLMREESQAYYGKSRIPALNFQQGFSIGAMPYIR